MNKRLIKQNIRTKIEEWIESITDTNLHNDLRQNIIVAGGSIVSLLKNEKVNDYDIYFKNPKFVPNIISYYENSPESDIEKFSVLATTENAITLSGDIQLITRFSGDPETVISRFDFEHCKNYYDLAEDKLVLKKEALESIATNELRYTGNAYPLASIIRTRKFIKRGWNINAAQYLKMCIRVNELNLRDPLVLRDQLAGIDMLYFVSFLENLEQKMTTEPGTDFRRYVEDVIDSYFDDENKENEIIEDSITTIDIPF